LPLFIARKWGGLIIAGNKIPAQMHRKTNPVRDLLDNFKDIGS
jgi:hypothetical protein